MNLRHFFSILSVAVLLSGCATTLDDRAPLSSYNQGGGAGIITYIMSPNDEQTFAAGKDIPIRAAANSMSGINRVEVIVNGQRIAKDYRLPYTAVISKPAAGKYVIHSVAYNIYGASKSSPGIVIQVE